MVRKNKVEQLDHQLTAITRQLDSIYTALVIRDPGTAVSADAFEGLRRQIIAGAQERMAHLVQLTEIDVALRAGADHDTLTRLVGSWLRQAGVVTVITTDKELCFEPVAGEGPWEVQIPAYLDEATGRIIRQGRLRQAPVPAVEPPSPADTAEATSDDTLAPIEQDNGDSES